MDSLTTAVDIVVPQALFSGFDAGLIHIYIREFIRSIKKFYADYPGLYSALRAEFFKYRTKEATLLSLIPGPLFYKSIVHKS